MSMVYLLSFTVTTYEWSETTPITCFLDPVRAQEEHQKIMKRISEIEVDYSRPASELPHIANTQDDYEKRSEELMAYIKTFGINLENFSFLSCSAQFKLQPVELK